MLINKAGKDKYADFGLMEQLAKAYTDGFVSSGDYVKFRKRKYGASSTGTPGDQFVVFNLNHDQVGNQLGKEWLSLLVDFDRQKVASAALLLSPYVPLLFMSEEYADQSPFYYFVSHTDPELIKAVQESRKKDFAAFIGDAELPDPEAEDTFVQSKLQWQTRTEGNHRIMLAWCQKLIELRRSQPPLRNVNKNDLRVAGLGQEGFVLYRQTSDGQQHTVCLFNLSDEEIAHILPIWVSSWNKLLDSKEPEWQDAGTTASELLPAVASPGQTLTLPP